MSYKGDDHLPSEIRLGRWGTIVCFTSEKATTLSTLYKSTLLHFNIVLSLIENGKYVDAIDAAFSRLDIKSKTYLLDQFILGFTFFTLSNLNHSAI
jgi:hypothetical protein